MHERIAPGLQQHHQPFAHCPLIDIHGERESTYRFGTLHIVHRVLQSRFKQMQAELAVFRLLRMQTRCLRP